MICLLSACSSNDQGDLSLREDQEQFPFSFISENFRHGGFDYPEEWDVTGVSSNVQLAYRDTENPENHDYSDTPYRYNFTFGQRADTNEVSENKLEKYNEQQALKEQTHRQHFYHTSYDYFAELKLSSNGFLNVLVEYDEAEHWEISNTPVLVLRQKNEWRANWLLNGTYYDLHVGNEAQIDNILMFEQLLEVMVDS